MIERIVIMRSTYRDSVTLMQLSSDVLKVAGVTDSAVVSATPLNQGLLAEQGFRLPRNLSPDDLVVAVRANNQEDLDAAVALINERLATRPTDAAGGDGSEPPRTFRSAVRTDPTLNVAFVSVPDQHAGYEVSAALSAGLNVFCFSSGVELEDEVSLKRQADRGGLLLMGPDCGTAILDGIGYGFANVVEPGPVGIVGASGTGIQQTCCLLAASGVGISQAIGVGSRDLADEVGGIMTRRALRLLADDRHTEIVLLLSKPPGERVRRHLSEWVARTGKRAVVALLGLGHHGTRRAANVEVLSRLEDAARRVTELAGGAWESPAPPEVPAVGGYVRGLFCGGSLCYEAMAVVTEALGDVRSNTPLRPEWLLADRAAPDGHAFIDFGHEDLTRGRAHPVMDPSLRNARFAQEARDSRVGVILIDVLLGLGAHPDPAAELAPLIKDALHKRPGALAVVVALCGTDADPQGYRDQRRRLEATGAAVTESAARAARAALRAMGAAYGF